MNFGQEMVRVLEYCDVITHARLLSNAATKTAGSSTSAGGRQEASAFSTWNILLPVMRSSNPMFKHRDVSCLTVGSLVERKMVNDGDKSISWSPIVIRTRPPVRRNSRFKTGLRIGS